MWLYTLPVAVALPLFVGAFVGVSLYRWIFGARGTVRLGPQLDRFEEAAVFVLPNPSGRNANFTYNEMLASFRRLRRRLRN